MKGTIFTEFLNFVALRHGDDFVDDMIHHSGLAATASYTSVGTYDFSELARLLGSFCTMSGVSAPDALKAFGRHLATYFCDNFEDFYRRYNCTFELLGNVEEGIHVEVRKLYPDAQLPRFEIVDCGEDAMVLRYSSCRPLADLAVGLIEASASYYNERFIVSAVPGEKSDHGSVFLKVERA